MDQDDSKHLPRIPEPFTLDSATPPLRHYHELVAYLWQNGHFNHRDQNNLATNQIQYAEVRDLAPDDPLIELAIASWQSLRPHAPQNGMFTEECHCIAELEEAHRCALPDIIPRPARGAKWDDACKHNLTTYHTLSSLTYPAGEDRSIDDAWREGLDLWNEVADLTLKYVNEPTAVRIAAQAQRLRGSILAWSELAYGSCRATLQQAYNSNVRWNWHLLWTTICHEIGHAIGIGHGGRGIMTPAYDSNVTELDNWDTDQVVSRYGQAIPVPPPPTPAPRPFHHADVVTYDAAGNRIARYEFKPAA